MAAEKAAILLYAPQEKPQVRPLGAETFAVNGVAPGALPNGLRRGAAGIHMFAQKFMPSERAAHGLKAVGLKPCVKKGENDIGSCICR